MQITRKQQGLPASSWELPAPEGRTVSLQSVVQRGICLPLSPHRSVLDSKENDLKAALQELESERSKERALQSQLEQEQLEHLQREGQDSKALEVRGPRMA